ncbi:MAG: hypothetical protein ACTSQE_08180, partial [Candidatus Heimdallarchaeaceae archaeon]
MQKNTVILFIVLLSLSLSVSLNTKETKATTKYVVLKCDDIGGLYDGNIYFYDYLLAHSDAIAELGIIGDNLVDSTEISKLQTLLERSQIDIFCHGMDHHQNADGTTEFYGVSVEEQKAVLDEFNTLMNTKLNYQAYIIGAPYNKIDENTYEACKQANYEILFYNSKGYPGDKDTIVVADDSVNHEHTNEQIKNDLSAITAELAVIQMHPKWWSLANLTTFFDWLYSDTFTADTGRQIILMSNYYVNIYLPSVDYEYEL